jgi:DNA-binding LacI/PurR family transcriptional regulator
MDGAMSQLSRKPLYQQIADVIREEIRVRHKPGQRLGTDLALAKRFSVSNVTTREAMLSLMQEGLVERKHGSGTFVAEPRAMPSRGGRHVAIWTELDIAEPRTSSFYSRVIQGLKVFLEEHGVAHQLYLGRRKPWEALRESSCPQLWKDIKAERLSGVLALGASPLWLKSLDQKAVPVVGWIDGYPHRVTMDVTWMMRNAIKYLLASGRRKIMMLRWNSPSQAETYEPISQAFEAIMRENGAIIRPAWVRSDLNPSRDGAGWEEFQKIWDSSREKPDGLIVSDDLLFRDVAMAILAMEIRVPDDLMVATHANKGSGMFYPFPVLRLELDVEQVIERMGRMLLDLMEGKEADAQVVEAPLRKVEGMSASRRSRPQRRRRSVPI